MGKRTPRAYLGGPDVFRADAKAHGERLKKICQEFGIDGVFPIDNEIDLSARTKREQAALIKRENVRLILGCDLMLANMEPWRGPGMDGGTAWEMGYAEALGLAVFGYTTDQRSYRERVTDARRHGDSFVDTDGKTIEDFDNIDNLMMAADPTAVYASARDAAEAAAKWWSDFENRENYLSEVDELKKLVNARLRPLS